MYVLSYHIVYNIHTFDYLLIWTSKLIIIQYGSFKNIYKKNIFLKERDVFHITYFSCFSFYLFILEPMASNKGSIIWVMPLQLFCF
jgi:hypothetical protein